MINFQLFPKSVEISPDLLAVVKSFEISEHRINSESNNLTSNEVLAIVKKDLEIIGYTVERGKRTVDKIKVPVLFGRNGKLEKYFDADGINWHSRTVIEIEAGRGVTNYQFLKDLFQACMMQDVDTLIIAIRNVYRGKSDFETVVTFFETLYSSERLKLPLKQILVIGY